MHRVALQVAELAAPPGSRRPVRPRFGGVREALPGAGRSLSTARTSPGLMTTPDDDDQRVRSPRRPAMVLPIRVGSCASSAAPEDVSATPIGIGA